MKKVSKNCIDLVKEFEGCYLKAYKDPVGVVTIGHGVTNADKAITGTTIRMGMTISQATADKWLKDALDKLYAPKVDKYDHIYHWNQNQFDALASFAYNIGSIDGLTDEGRRSVKTIADKMLLYNRAGGRVLAGLTRRRKAERALFLKAYKPKGYSGDWPSLPKRGFFKVGDGITVLTSYKTQIKRTQRLVNWVMDFNLTVDGQYGEKTAKAVSQLQKRFGLQPNGCFGEKCIKKIRNFKK